MDNAVNPIPQPTPPVPESHKIHVSPAVLVAGGLLVVSLMTGVGYMLGKQASRSEVAQVTPTAAPSPTSYAAPTSSPSKAVDETADWKTYTSSEHNFTLKHPPASSIEIEASTENSPIKLTMIGPTQKAQTDMSDGALMYFWAGDLVGKSLKEFVDEIANDSEVSILLRPVTPTTFKNQRGYTFQKRGLGDVTSIYISKDNMSYFALSYVVEDPTNQGFQKTVNTILSTFKFTK